MLQALYCISLPLAIKGAAHMLDVWVDILPSQVDISCSDYNAFHESGAFLATNQTAVVRIRQC